MTPTSRPPVALAWLDDRRGVRLLDQTLLPSAEVYLDLEDVDGIAESIRSLRVRGAPAIGIAAAMGLAVGMARCCEARSDGIAGDGDRGVREAFDSMESVLLSTRPTGRNLAWALRRMKVAFDEAGGGRTALPALFEEADEILCEDRLLCQRIGEHGLGLCPPEGARVLTHCNAGALATGGIGTALAPIYLARQAGVPVRVWSCETRPVLQGARLTAWELERAGVDVTVVTDSMAGALMSQGQVDLVIVGADAVARNGDVVNKIGTYPLAVLAQHHGIPFYVALPRSTFDRSLATGRDVPIEERESSEVRSIGEAEFVPAGVHVWNPAFDVTPAHLVTALVTDMGVLRPPYGPSIERALGDEADEPEGMRERS